MRTTGQRESDTHLARNVFIIERTAAIFTALSINNADEPPARKSEMGDEDRGRKWGQTAILTLKQIIGGLKHRVSSHVR